MGIFGKSDAKRRMTGYEGGAPTVGQRVGKAARGLFGGVNRFAEETLNPTTPLGQLGMYLGAASGSTLGEAALRSKYDRQDEEQQNLIRAYKLRELYQPKYEKVGKNLIGIDPVTGEPSLVYEGEEEDTPLLREMKAANIDPQSEEGRLMIARAARGYQYSPEMVDQRIATETAIAQARAAATAANRAPARGGRITATAVDDEGNRVGWNGSAWVPM